jgi:hypothetical protein
MLYCSVEQETYKEKMNKASDNGTKEVDPATQLNLWAESAGGRLGDVFMVLVIWQSAISQVYPP